MPNSLVGITILHFSRFGRSVFFHQRSSCSVAAISYKIILYSRHAIAWNISLPELENTIISAVHECTPFVSSQNWMANGAEDRLWIAQSFDDSLDSLSLTNRLSIRTTLLSWLLLLCIVHAARAIIKRVRKKWRIREGSRDHHKRVMIFYDLRSWKRKQCCNYDCRRRPYARRESARKKRRRQSSWRDKVERRDQCERQTNKGTAQLVIGGNRQRRQQWKNLFW